MGEFSGFSEVRGELRRGFRRRLANLAIEVEGFGFLASREYVTGRDLATGLALRATLADLATGLALRATLADRGPGAAVPSLADRSEQLGPGGVLVLTDARMNRNGTYEAFNALPFPAGSTVLTDGVARVSAPVQRDGGAWSQSIQHLRTGRAVACTAYHDVVDAVLASLAEPGPGRAGAAVRGWHAARGGIMSFEIGRRYDPAARAYAGPEESFDAFLAERDVYVGGLDAWSSGERCMEILSGLMAAHPGEIVWEVIPKRTYSMGGLAAEAAGLGTRRDASAPYRTGSRPRATGCLPSVIAFVERDGVRWPRFVAPSRGDGVPIPEPYVATANAAPEPPVPDARATRDAARTTAAPARRPGAPDPMAAPDAPAPLPPDLAFPSFPEGADGTPRSPVPGIEPDDPAALSRLDDLAAELRGLNAAWGSRRAANDG